MLDTLESSRETGIKAQVQFLSDQLGGTWSGSIVKEHDKKTNMPIDRQSFLCVSNNKAEREYLTAVAEWLGKKGIVYEATETKGRLTLWLPDKVVKKLTKEIESLLQPASGQTFDTLSARICAEQKIEPAFAERNR